MESPKKLAPSLSRLNLRAKGSVNQASRAATHESSTRLVSKSTTSEVSKFHAQKSSFPENADEETASDDDEDDLDAMPKAPKIGLISKAPIPRPESRSIFPKTKPQHMPILGQGMESFKERPTSSVRSIIQPSTVGQPSEREKPALRKQNPGNYTPSDALSKPAEGTSRMADIKKRLAEKRRREEEFF